MNERRVRAPLAVLLVTVTIVLGTLVALVRGTTPVAEPNRGQVTIQRSCDVDDDLDLVARVLVEDTIVDLACGDRLVTREGSCFIQRGPAVTEVPCRMRQTPLGVPEEWEDALGPIGAGWTSTR